MCTIIRLVVFCTATASGFAAAQVSNIDRSSTLPSHVFDGTYFHDALKFGYRIGGNEGIITVSNTPLLKAGDVALYLTQTSSNTFKGAHFCTDGNYHPVTATLNKVGDLEFTIQGCAPSRFTMVRQQDAIDSNSRPGRQILATRDFVVEQESQVVSLDGSIVVDAKIFNTSPADGVLEIRDSSGMIIGMPTLLLGHRPIPSSIEELLVGNQKNVLLSMMSEYPIFDRRNPAQSHLTLVHSIRIPAGGNARVTKVSDYALAYNALGFVIDGAGLISVDGSTIDQHRLNAIVRSLALNSMSELKNRLLSKDINLKEVPAITWHYAFDIAVNMLSPENIDGRTKLGRMIKEQVKDLAPVMRGLEVIALEGWAFNWFNALVNLEGAYQSDSSIEWNVPAAR